MDPAASPLLRLPPSVAVWRVAWPMAALGLLRTLTFLTDAAWVGRLGPEELAALGGSAFAGWIVALVAQIPATGAHARIAGLVGAGRRSAIGETFAASLLAGLALAVALLAVGLPLRGTYLATVGFDAAGAPYEAGQRYLAAVLAGGLAMAASASVGAVFRGLGRTRAALGLAAIALSVNLVVDPLLIWGAGPVPAFGVAGAAWATALAHLVGAAAGLVVLVREGLAPRLPAAGLLRLLRVGAPVGISGVGFALTYVLLGRIITRFGEHQMAALGVGHRVEGLAYLLCLAAQVGAATLVGQHLGAGDVGGARRAAAAAARLAVVAMLPLTALLWLFAGPIFGVFTADATTAAAGALYLRVQALVLVGMALEEVALGAFTGAERTAFASALTFALTAARIPTAYLLAVVLDLGVLGVWVAIAGSTAIKGASLWWRWQRLDLGPQ
jgi:putative MATE family efflux protein